MTLDDLGPRICILGPPASGKSTLADAVSRARGIPAFHLDLLRHLPGTDWDPRPEAAFIALHDAAIAGDDWVIDGNYASLLPQRLARATGLVLLDVPTATSLLRYLCRCLSRRGRVGGLEGGRDSIKWDMVRHILGAARRDRRRHVILFEELTLPKVRLSSPAATAAFYRANAISRPSASAITAPRPGRDAGTSRRAGDR